MNVDTLVTDRHKQICRYMQKMHSKIDHHYDVWYVAKGNSYIWTCMHAVCMYIWAVCILIVGIKKKLARLSNNSDCEIVGEWIKSISNHMYWCAAFAPGGEILKWWLSLMEHICDSHDNCYHPNLGESWKKCLTPGEGVLDENKHISDCLTAGSKASEKLSDIILNKRLTSEIQRLLPTCT